MGVDDESDFNWLARMSVSYVGDIKFFRKTDVPYSVSSGDIFPYRQSCAFTYSLTVHLETVVSKIQ